MADKEKDYIPVAHNFYIGDTKLAPRELFVYASLHARRNYFTKETTITNFNLLTSEISFVKKEQSNKKYIEHALLTLHKQKVLLFDYTNIRKDNKLVVSFKLFEKGYTKIPYNYLLMTNDPEEFMILCYIEKVNRSISFVEFADVLGKSERHVKELIPDMEQKQMINVVHGRYYVNKRQEINSYNVNANCVSTVVENEVIENKKNNDDEIEEIENETVEHNWYSGSKLIVDDLVLFLMTTDKQLKYKAQNRIDAISNTEKGEKVMNKLMKEAESKVYYIQQQIKQDEKLEQQRDLLQMVKTAQGTVIKRENDYYDLKIDDIDNLKFIDSIVLVEKVEDNNMHGYGIWNDALNHHTINNILTGDINNGNSYRKYKQETKEVIFDKFKEIIRENRVFAKEHFLTITLFRNKLLEEINKGKIIDSDWEGDEYRSYDGKTEDNVSREKRINEENNIKKREEIRLYQDEQL